jgi:hypothetical protein
MRGLSGAVDAGAGAVASAAVAAAEDAEAAVAESALAGSGACKCFTATQDPELFEQVRQSIHPYTVSSRRP